MTDQTTPDVTDDDRKLAREWAESIESTTNSAESTTNPWSDRAIAAARVILDAVPAPPRPTLADMTPEERAACQWMQCDVTGFRGRWVLATPYDEDGDAGLISACGEMAWSSPAQITPRPDLPRLEWPDDQKADDVPPVKVGDVIESADDPRLAALPAGTVLRDLDGEEVTRSEGGPGTWRGAGYIPIPSQGNEFGPWTVRRIGLVADQ